MTIKEESEEEEEEEEEDKSLHSQIISSIYQSASTSAAEF